MNRSNKILVMAGAREANLLVAALLGRGRDVVASLPEAGRMFEDLPVPTHVGAFNGSPGFRDFLYRERIRTVMDASHAFDTAVSDLAAEVSHQLSLRYIRVLRPPWAPARNDIWHSVGSISAAVSALPGDARVFSNTGWPSLTECAQFSGQRLFMRQTDDTHREPLYPFVEFVEGRPPFTQFQEQDLFEALAITHLLCRNTGGAASMSKLLAARALGLPVYMVERPVSKLQEPRVETVAEALAWEAA